MTLDLIPFDQIGTHLFEDLDVLDPPRHALHRGRRAPATSCAVVKDGDQSDVARHCAYACVRCVKKVLVPARAGAVTHLTHAIRSVMSSSTSVNLDTARKNVQVSRTHLEHIVQMLERTIGVLRCDSDIDRPPELESECADLERVARLGRTALLQT